MKPIIEVKGLYKEYRRGAQKERYLNLRDQIFKSFKLGGKKDAFNALEDINFDVYPGDSLAIIGKNGAGKSTLLKILSKITPPTKGEIILRGRLASLLEVGTGFHPELTGRENVYLNGSILGLGRAEINRQFDAIVDFSGVEAFLDTPLKHYSSGMQLRLAFAVAAHLEPEILVIDEVLAVGDSAFQQKCIEKMTEVSQSGRTLLFVSHNIQAIKNLCKTGILLNSGQILESGDVEGVISKYSQQTEPSLQKNQIPISTPRTGKGEVQFTHFFLPEVNIPFGKTIKIGLSIRNNSRDTMRDLDIAIAIKNSIGVTVLHFSNKYLSLSENLSDPKGKFWFGINNSLKPGKYSLIFFIKANDEIQDWIKDIGSFVVLDGNAYGYNNSSEIQGIYQPKFTFYRENI